MIMGHVSDTAFLLGQKTHITRSRAWYGFFARAKDPYHQVGCVVWLFCSGKRPISPGHVGDMAFLLRQKKNKKHITTFGALGGRAFDSIYDMK